MSNEINQAQNDKYCMISLLCGIQSQFKSRVLNGDVWVCGWVRGRGGEKRVKALSITVLTGAISPNDLRRTNYIFQKSAEHIVSTIFTKMTQDHVCCPLKTPAWLKLQLCVTDVSLYCENFACSADSPLMLFFFPLMQLH